MYQLFTFYKILIPKVFHCTFYFCIHILPQLVLPFMKKDVAGEVEGKGKGNEDLDNSLKNRYVPKFLVDNNS